MDIKSLLVHLDRGPRTEVRLSLALGLAKTFDARVVGLFTPAVVEIPQYAGAQSAMADILQRKLRESLDASQAAFNAALASADGIEGEWRAADGEPIRCTCVNARYADLVVLGQRDPDAEEDDGVPADFVERVIIDSGRPVLIVPYAGRFKTVGRRALIAWDAGREATLAVTWALPLLRRADEVHVVAFDPEKRGDHGELPCADISRYLARHGVKVTAGDQSGTRLDVASQILSRAADEGADLIVMGAYSHSRLREHLFGGATQEILRSMTVPVLMAH